MRVVPPRPLGLPRVNQLHPSVSLDAIARALARMYDDMVAEGVPEHLAEFVRRLEARAGEGGGAPAPLALVVEDEPMVRRLAATVLADLGLLIAEAEDAEAALAVMEERGAEVALVFADIRLPGGLDGVDLAQRIAARWPQTRIVVTSGLPGDRVSALPENVRFLPKPWRGLDVVAEARQAVSEAAGRAG